MLVLGPAALVYIGESLTTADSTANVTTADVTTADSTANVTTADSTANVTTADSTANVSTADVTKADVLVLGYGLWVRVLVRVWVRV